MISIATCLGPNDCTASGLVCLPFFGVCAPVQNLPSTDVPGRENNDTCVRVVEHHRAGAVKDKPGQPPERRWTDKCVCHCRAAQKH